MLGKVFGDQVQPGVQLGPGVGAAPDPLHHGGLQTSSSFLGLSSWGQGGPRPECTVG